MRGLLTNPVDYGIFQAAIVAAIVVGVVSSYHVIYVLLEARRDLDAIRQAGIGNGRRVVAQDAVRSEWARVWAVGLLAVGMFLLMVGLTSVDTSPDTVMLSTMVTVLAIIAAELVLAFDAILAMHARRVLDEELRRSHADRATGADVHADEVRDATVTVDDNE